MAPLVFGVRTRMATHQGEGFSCRAESPGSSSSWPRAWRSAGIGDPYFPLEGNGGYDVRHYDLSFSYDPATDRLDALNKITARATQNLSRFDLDFQQLTVKGVEVNDRAASFTRDGQELALIDRPAERWLRGRPDRRERAARGPSGFAGAALLLRATRWRLPPRRAF
jgi:hypothetical protein